MEKLLPRDFARVYPCCSTFGKAEAERMAYGAMKWMDDKWEPPITIEQCQEVLDVAGFNHNSITWMKWLFDILPYCKGPEEAKKFALIWRNRVEAPNE